MGTTYEALLQQLVDFRERQFHSEPEREQARIENLEFILQTLLEKLRDSERLRP